MNLDKAQALSNLRREKQAKSEDKLTRTARQIARRVFQVAAQGGDPYRGQTFDGWARKWLASKEFVLMEIDASAVAAPCDPRNPARVAERFLCSAEQYEPIVVDLNKNNVGRTMFGKYVPEVIVVDGKHRRKAAMQQGRARITAWVGIKAAAKIKTSKLVASIDAPTDKIMAPSKIGTALSLYAAVSPSTDIPVTQQDTGQGGSRPTKMQSAGGGAGASNAAGSGLNPLRQGLESCGARGSGHLDSSDPTDRLVGLNERKKWKVGQTFDAPGTDGSVTGGDPSADAPGAGVGPRLKPSTGGSNSDMSRRMKAGKFVKEMYEDEVDAVAPPGREDQVKTLKKKVGKNAAFKIAWNSYNNRKSKKRKR